jgi:hypothetical protein
MILLTLIVVVGAAGLLGATLRSDFTGRTRLGAQIRRVQIIFREWASRQSLFVKIALVFLVIFCGFTILWWPLFVFGRYKPFSDFVLGGGTNFRLIFIFLAGAAVAKFSAKYL